jgi:hypothetical protein
MQNVTKKLGFLLVFVFAIIELGGPIFFLSIFFLSFLVVIRVQGAKKIFLFPLLQKN